MKFLADDDRFGIVVTPAGWRHMYQFRLVIGGRLIGDAEPCIIGSAMMRLGSLTTLSDPRLSLALTDPAALIRLVASTGELDIESGEEPDSADTDLHDGTVLSLAESLDSWLVLGFRARPRGRLPGDLPGRRCPGPGDCCCHRAVGV